MSKLSTKFQSARQDWETPQDLFDEIDSIYHFDCDLAASPENTKVASRYLTVDDDAMQSRWSGLGGMPGLIAGNDQALKRSGFQAGVVYPH